MRKATRWGKLLSRGYSARPFNASVDASWREEWSRGRDWPTVPPEILPEMTLVAEYKGKPIIMGSLFRTDSPIAWLEFVLGNPAVKGKRMEEAQIVLLGALHGVASYLGYRWVWTSTAHPRWCKRLEENGYTVADTGMMQLIRALEPWSELGRTGDEGV